MGAVLVQTVFVLLGVCLLAVVVLRWGAARFGGIGDATPMEVMARLPLEPRRSLLVVRVGSRTLMLASSEAGVQAVGELDADDAAQFVIAASTSSASEVNVSRETSAVLR